MEGLDSEELVEIELDLTLKSRFPENLPAPDAYLLLRNSFCNILFPLIEW